MAINLATLGSRASALSFEYEGETVNEEVYFGKITPAYRAMLSRLDKEDVGEEARDSAAVMLSDLVAKWDVMAGEEVAPLGYETFSAVPIDLIAANVRAIWDAVGKRMSGELSD